MSSLFFAIALTVGRQRRENGCKTLVSSAIILSTLLCQSLWVQGLVAEQRDTEVDSVEGNLVTLILSHLYDCLKSFPSRYGDALFKSRSESVLRVRPFGPALAPACVRSPSGTLDPSYLDLSASQSVYQAKWCCERNGRKQKDASPTYIPLLFSGSSVA